MREKRVTDPTEWTQEIGSSQLDPIDWTQSTGSRRMSPGGPDSVDQIQPDGNERPDSIDQIHSKVAIRMFAIDKYQEGRMIGFRVAGPVELRPRRRGPPRDPIHWIRQVGLYRLGPINRIQSNEQSKVD